MIAVPTTDTVSTTLLMALKADDRMAFERLTRLFSPTIRNRFRRLGVPSSDIADLEQNTLVRVWRGLPAFQRKRAEASFRSWLMTIARHVASDYFERRVHPECSIDCDRMHLLAAEAVERGDEHAARATEEIAGELHRMLELIRGDFSATTYAIFNRYWFDGHDTDCIAREFSMRKATVREARNRVMRRLRDEFAELYSESDWPFPSGRSVDDRPLSRES